MERKKFENRIEELYPNKPVQCVKCGKPYNVEIIHDEYPHGSEPHCGHCVVKFIESKGVAAYKLVKAF